VLGDPGLGAVFEGGGKGGVTEVEGRHAGAKPLDVERVDGEGSVAAGGAAFTANEPGAGAAGGVGESGVHNLDELSVASGERHVARLRPWTTCNRGHTGRGRDEACVIYLEHTPAPPLNRFVRMLWYAQAPQPAHRRERVLPTGRTQVILNLARDFILDCPEEPVAVGPMVRVAPSLVIGSRSVYEEVDTSDMADLIGMVFEPGAFPVFAGDAADLFSNRSVDLEDIWGAAARSLRDRLREIPTPAGKLGCLEADLTARLNAQFVRRAVKLHGAVDFALTRFGRAPGVATVAEVAKSTGWSERRFSQVFREQVGLSPKIWCRVQRFQLAVQRLHGGRDVRWSELALDCGFYDQAHFANEFRAFSGIDPTTYSAARGTPWANHVRVD
jgi:AraC-like DNA-binding protein